MLFAFYLVEIREKLQEYKNSEISAYTHRIRPLIGRYHS